MFESIRADDVELAREEPDASGSKVAEVAGQPYAEEDIQDKDIKDGSDGRLSTIPEEDEEDDIYSNLTHWLSQMHPDLQAELEAQQEDWQSLLESREPPAGFDLSSIFYFASDAEYETHRFTDDQWVPDLHVILF